MLLKLTLFGTVIVLGKGFGIFYTSTKNNHKKSPMAKVFQLC